MNWLSKESAAAVINERNAKIGANLLKRFLLSLFVAVILIGISFVILSPVIAMLSKSFLTLEDRYNPLVYLIPINPTGENYKIAFQYLDYTKSFAVTLLFSGLMMLIQTFICALAGYGFARFRFPGNGVLFALVLLTIIIPVQTIMVPLYMQFRNFDVLGILHLFTGKGMNLLNTPVPMGLLSLTGMGLRSGLFIYIFRQFFRGMPKEFEEASFIDGAGTFRTYFQIMLPNAGPPMITVVLFAFVWQYNDTFFASLFGIPGLLSTKLTTLSSTITAILKIRDPNQVDLSVNAGLVLAILPVIVIYLILQKYFMQGVERSGIVG